MFTTKLLPLAAGVLLLAAPVLAASTWQDANKASVALMNEGKPREAFDLAWKAAELYEKAPTYKAASHEKLLLNAADIFLLTGNASGAPEMLLNALGAIGRHVPADAPETIALNEQLAKAYLALGDGSRAQQTYQRVVALNEKHYGADSVGSVLAQLDLARAARSAGDPDTARRQLDRLGVLTGQLAPDHPLRLQVAFEQAMSSMSDGRDNAAAAQFRSIVGNSRDSRNEAVRHLARDSYGMLAFIAHRQGDPQTEDGMVESTRNLPRQAGAPTPLFRTIPEIDESSLRGSATMELQVSAADGKVSAGPGQQRRPEICGGDEQGGAEMAFSADRSGRRTEFADHCPSEREQRGRLTPGVGSQVTVCNLMTLKTHRNTS